MKMYDKNGKLSPVGQAIFNSGMERLRNNEDPLSIAKDLKSQVKLVEFNGDFIEAQRSKLRGWYFWLFRNIPSDMRPVVPKAIIAPKGTMTGRFSKAAPPLGAIPYRESPWLRDRIITIS